MKPTSILVVEDEVIIAKDLTLTLTKLGYAIAAHCVSGEEAVKMAVEKQPDIILMDIMLKGDMTGIDAAKEIRNRQNTPVVFITAYSDEDTINRTNAAAPYGYIVKPFKPNDLRATIETALNRFREEGELRKENYILHKIYKQDSHKEIFYL